jgi:hypothetical protein
MRKNKIALLMPCIDEYKKRFGYYPKEVLADQINCNRDNPRELKLLGIKLLSKPLGRLSMSVAVKEYVRPEERSPIEGKFGQGKNAYVDSIHHRIHPDPLQTGEVRFVLPFDTENANARSQLEYQ